MMVLNTALRKYEKVPEVAYEVEKRNIPFTSDTYAIWCKSCRDGDAIEGFLDELESDREREFDDNYVIAKGRYTMDHRDVIDD